MTYIEEMVNRKPDLETLGNMERAIYEKLNEIVRALTKQLADKSETKKALKLLER
jgi:hypothetical protein